MDFSWLGTVLLLAECCERLRLFFPYTPGMWRRYKRSPLDEPSQALLDLVGRRVAANGHSRPRMHVRSGRLAAAADMLSAGHAIREAARATGVSTQTLCKLRRILAEAGSVPTSCPCGRPALHRGMCAVRRGRAG